MANTSCCLYKVLYKEELAYILIVWGKRRQCSHHWRTGCLPGTESSGSLCRKKMTKNTFMQKLLLGNYQDVEAFNRAKKLHISSTARRAVFLVETRQARDEHALATIRNIFSAPYKRFYYLCRRFRNHCNPGAFLYRIRRGYGRYCFYAGRHAWN